MLVFKNVILLISIPIDQEIGQSNNYERACKYLIVGFADLGSFIVFR